MVADELEVFMLGEYDSFFVERAVPEMEDQMVCDLIAVGELSNFPSG